MSPSTWACPSSPGGTWQWGLRWAAADKCSGGERQTWAASRRGADGRLRGGRALLYGGGLVPTVDGDGRRENWSRVTPGQQAPHTSLRERVRGVRRDLGGQACPPGEGDRIRVSPWKRPQRAGGKDPLREGRALPGG